MVNPTKQTNTVGVQAKFEKLNALGDLWVEVVEQFKNQPDVCFNGGNDKEFFSFKFLGVKLFAARNELDGLTVMLPEEY
jgi:hypothetical protein